MRGKEDHVGIFIDVRNERGFDGGPVDIWGFWWIILCGLFFKC